MQHKHHIDEQKATEKAVKSERLLWIFWARLWIFWAKLWIFWASDPKKQPLNATHTATYKKPQNRYTYYT
jgi:hypothetical protein